MNRETLENTVRVLTALGDAWADPKIGKLYRHPIYLLRDGVPGGLTARELFTRHARISAVLTTIMAQTGRLVTDEIIDDIIEFVEETANNDDFND